MAPIYFAPTPLQLAALAVHIAADLTWHGPGEGQFAAYGTVIDARQDIEAKMGTIECREFWALLQLLGELRHVARALVEAAS